MKACFPGTGGRYDGMTDSSSLLLPSSVISFVVPSLDSKIWLDSSGTGNPKIYTKGKLNKLLKWYYIQALLDTYLSVLLSQSCLVTLNCIYKQPLLDI